MRSFFSIAGIIAVLASASVLHAQSGACIPGTLASFEALANGCSVGIDDFTGFRATGGLDATKVEVTPVPAAGGGGGFELSALNTSVFAVAAGNTAIYDVFWDLFVDAGPEASSASIGMDPPMGNVTLTQDYCTNSTFNSDGVCSGGIVQSLSVSSPPCLTDPITDPTDCQSTLDFNPFLDSAGVKTIIDLNGVDTTDGSSFDGVTGTAANTDTSTPEPITSVLTLAGLLGIGLLQPLQGCRKNSMDKLKQTSQSAQPVGEAQPVLNRCSPGFGFFQVQDVAASGRFNSFWGGPVTVVPSGRLQS